MFPGYVLVKMVMTDETGTGPQHARLYRLLFGQDKSAAPSPIPLTEDEIAAMGVEKRERSRSTMQWATVCAIIDGPLAGFIGVVSALEPTRTG